MGNVFAIVPVKPIEEGKSRLAAVLPQAERTELVRGFVERALDCVATFPGAARTIVVSRSESILADARARGMIAMPEQEPDLNASLALAVGRAIALEAKGALIFPVDLPLATASILRSIAQRHAEGRICVLASDRHGRGTNLMFQHPPSAELLRYGADSFQKHQAAAEALGYPVVIWNDPALALDIDEPDDYALWRATEHGT